MPDNIWDEEAIQETLVAVGLNAGVEADLPDEARFVRRIRELLMHATERHGALACPSLYLMSAGADDAHKDPDKLHRRLHAGERDPSGRIWLMGAAAKAGYEVIAENVDSEGLMRFANNALDLGNVPAVLYEPYGETLAWYPNGVNEPDLVFEGPLALTQPPSLEELITIVDQIYHYRLLTSFHQNADTSLWTDPGKHWVHDSAERRVQDALTVGISGACADPFFVDEELKGHTGRYDIGLRERIGPGTTRLHTVLELKVARSFGKNGAAYPQAQTEANVISGVEQVHSYAGEHEASGKACLVFDLRKREHQGVFEEGEAKAVEFDVLLQFWPCFPNAQHYRDFVTSE